MISISLNKAGLKIYCGDLRFFVLFFFCYMFKDEKDDLKRNLIKKLNFTTWCWFSLELAAFIAKIISGLFENGII